MDILDKFISFAIAMLILSLVVEKITNFWKQHESNHLRVKREDPEDEKKRAYGIQRATILVGITVAFLFQANAIQIIQSPYSNEIIGWGLVTADATRFAELESLDAQQLGDQGYHKPSILYAKRLRLQEGEPQNWWSVFFLAGAFVLAFIGIVTRRLKNKFWNGTICAILSSIAISVSGLLDYVSNKTFFLTYFELFLGVIISGVAISFGSKFWHDLLDLLFQVRSLKEKLNTKALYEIEDTQQLTEFVKDGKGSAFEDINEFLKVKKNDLMGYSKVVGVATGYKEVAGADTSIPSIIVYVIKKEESPEKKLPAHFVFTNAQGKEILIPLDVIETGRIRSANYKKPKKKLLVDPQTGKAAPGCSISLDGEAPAAGTWGCVVRRGEHKYLLSCAHVLNGEEKMDVVSPAKPHLEGEEKPEVVAKYSGNKKKDSILNEYVDGAVAKLQNPNMDARIALNSTPVGHRIASEADIDILVKMTGCVSADQVGSVKHICKSITVDYGGYERLMKDVIVTTLMTTDGDSGALLMDSRDKAIGICIATSETISVFAPITTALVYLGVELVTAGQV